MFRRQIPSKAARKSQKGMCTAMKTKAIQIAGTPADVKEILKSVGAALLSFLFGAARLFGAISPFSVALVCGLPLKYALTATVGGIVSTLIFARPGYASFYITALLLALGARILLSRFIRHRLKPVFYSLTAFTVTALCTVFFGLIRSVTLIDLILMIVEVMLTSCFAYFFAVSGNALLRRRSTVFSYTELASICILLIAVLTSFAHFSVFRVNLGVILGVAAIYAVMSRYGITGSSVASIVVSISLCLYSMDMLEFCGLLIIAGFLAGAFAPLGKFGQMAAFVAVGTFCLLIMGAPLFLTYRMIDVFFATALFVLVPDKWLNRIKPDDSAHSAASAVIDPRFMQGSVSAKLAFASDTIRDLQEELEDVSSRFCEIDYNNICLLYTSDAADD